MRPASRRSFRPVGEGEFADHAFLGGRLLLREPRRGHRSGTDAVLLAAASRVGAGQHLLDAGAGAGGAALAILFRVDDATATLVERDPHMAALARHNIQVNGFADRASVVEGDLFDRMARLKQRVAPIDVVVSNPPFYEEGTVRASPNMQKAASHVLSSAGHGAWLRELFTLAVPRTRVILIHRPDALPSLIKAAEGRAAVRLRTVHPRDGMRAHRVILECAPGRRTPMIIDPPLTLHGEDGRFTPFADDLHRGKSWL